MSYAIQVKGLLLLCLLPTAGGCGGSNEPAAAETGDAETPGSWRPDASATDRDSEVHAGMDGEVEAVDAGTSGGSDGARDADNDGAPDAGSRTAQSGRCSGGVEQGRFMECLDRGVFALSSAEGAFVSWRLLGTDPADIAFRLYREAAGVTERVCERAANEGTWCTDRMPPASARYFVRPLVAGVEGEASGANRLQPNDYLSIPLKSASAGAVVHLAWVGDLDGDGEYDLVVDRIGASAPLVDAYSRAGAFLFRLNTGPLGENQDNIEGGATTISNGNWDGLTVYDFDGDGRAEIAIKTARGFVFGDGATLQHGNDSDQFVSIVSGDTGAELARARLPGDYQADGPLQCHFGVGYFDGVRPSVAIKCKNRVGSGGFNLVAATYDFDGKSLKQRWKYLHTGDGADFHQIRIQDVDGDGKDELCPGGFVIGHDGKLLYSLSAQGVIHGDRFHITDMDPKRPGLEGWGIQQDNPNGLETYYYDAATGKVLRKYSAPNGPGADVARGTVADLFPDHPGLEYWSFNGMYAAGSGEQIVAEVNENVPWPNFHMQWDGDVGSELLDNNRVGDWDLVARSRNRYSWRHTFEGLVQARGAIPFYGDIFGDWREEAVLETADHSELRVYGTTMPTDRRLYTLVHNPAYRNHLAVHGYKQSHLVDYYLGFGMADPPMPKIRLVERR